MKPVHFSTCVWGPWHLDMLTRIVWPCLLADGNLPAFMREFAATYRICTTRRDQMVITADGTITTSDPDPGAQVHIVLDSDDLFFLSLAPL